MMVADWADLINPTLYMDEIDAKYIFIERLVVNKDHSPIETPQMLLKSFYFIFMFSNLNQILHFPVVSYLRYN